MNAEEASKKFYDEQFSNESYATARYHYNMVKNFVAQFQLDNKPCLEIGCGRGALQDLAGDYTAVDIAASVRKFMHKPFYQASATALPFRENQFDGIWSSNVLEHVPEPEKALVEMRRVLKPNGYLLLAPAWHTRPWAADGYEVRPYGDFHWKGKLIKASIPIRNNHLFMSLSIFPRRIFRGFKALISKEPTIFQYIKLKANYERFWSGDSDACNSMDSYDALLWFVSRGDKCLSHPSRFSRFFVRSGGLIFQIKKPLRI